MWIDRALRRSSLSCVVALALSVIPVSGGAVPPKPGVSLAEVASRIDPAKTRLTNLTELLRSDAEAELLAIDWGKLRRRYAVSAALVRLDSTSTGERTLAAACTVSASVRDADTGKLLFLVEGKARAEDASTAGARAERDALSAAVRGAITAVPEGLRRSSP